MILKITLFLEGCLHNNTNSVRTERIKAAFTLKKLLSQINHSAEEIPGGEPEKLQQLFTSLKGEALNKEETALLLEIANQQI